MRTNKHYKTIQAMVKHIVRCHAEPEHFSIQLKDAEGNTTYKHFFGEGARDEAICHLFDLDMRNAEMDCWRKTPRDPRDPTEETRWSIYTHITH